MTQRIENIDSLRGLSAIYVMFFHSYFLGNIYIYEGRIKDVIVHGDIGVPIFFVISGFSITYSIIKKDFFNFQELKGFYIRRIYRIIPLFYIAFILNFIISLLSNNSFKLYDSLLTISFLFPFVQGHQESLVMAGWSLGIEMVFYLIFPLLLLLLKSNMRYFNLLILLCSSIYFISSNYSDNTHLNFGYQLVFFLIGMFFCFNFSKFSEISKKGTISIPIILIFLGLLTLFSGMTLLKNIPFYIFKFPGIVLLTLGCLLYNGKILVNRLFRILGNLSYSIYLLHPVIIIVLVKLKFNIYTYNKFPNYGFLFFIFSVGIIVIGFSFLSYFFIEKPFIILGKKKIQNLKTN